MWGRIRQTLQAITAWFRPVEDAHARQYLSSAEFDLFQTMPRRDRQHHLRVLKKILKTEQTHPALCAAALLHDVGKTRYPFPTWQRILVVAVKLLAPQKFIAWSQCAPIGWKTPFVMSAQHPAWGAEMAEKAGSLPLTIELIRRHQDQLGESPQTEVEILLQYLRKADDAS